MSKVAIQCGASLRYVHLNWIYVKEYNTGCESVAVLFYLSLSHHKSFSLASLREIDSAFDLQSGNLVTYKKKQKTF